MIFERYDYKCPYCEATSIESFDEWEHKDFEDSTEIYCECGKVFTVFRTWSVSYDNIEPDECFMCPGSDRWLNEDGWGCRVGGCEAVSYD